MGDAVALLWMLHCCRVSVPIRLLHRYCRCPRSRQSLDSLWLNAQNRGSCSNEAPQVHLMDQVVTGEYEIHHLTPLVQIFGCPENDREMEAPAVGWFCPPEAGVEAGLGGRPF